jgi:rubredoxin
MFSGPPPGERRFVCMLCMHVYDEREGDPDSGLPPGTLWEDVPEDWRCPQCGASKRFFENEATFQQMEPRDGNAPGEEISELPPGEDGPDKA